MAIYCAYQKDFQVSEGDYYKLLEHKHLKWRLLEHCGTLQIG